MKELYWKYQLDLVNPKIAFMQFHDLESMIIFVNRLKHGLGYDLKDVVPFKIKPPIRYKGQYYLTKTGRIRIRF